MSTTVKPPERVTLTADQIRLDSFDYGEVRDGQGLQMGATGLYSAAFDPTRDPDSVSLAEVDFERQVIDPAIEDILPQVAAMLSAAIEKRLPWTWEPDKPAVSG